jgi:hypothetical protein
MTPIRAEIEREAIAQGLTMAQVLGGGRKPVLVKFRWSVFNRLYREGMTSTQIGKIMSRDPSVVRYALSKL